MREIKFRAWNILDKTIYYLNRTLCEIPYYELFLHTPDSRPYNLMQWTGLKDKNGKEIYEGDILKHNPEDDDWNDYVVWWPERARFELHSFITFPIQKVADEFYEGDIARAEMNRNGTMLQLADWCLGSSNPSEVIGNIYENPELLETK